VRLIVISPEAEDAREPAVLAELCAAGLEHYHLRKPTWSRGQLAEWLRTLPASLHARIVLHSYHDLAAEFALGGLHDRDHPANPAQSECHLLGDTFAGTDLDPTRQNQTGRESECHLLGDTRTPARLRSRAVHTLSALRDSLQHYDRLLLSPVFPSLSKPGHGPSADFVFSDLRAVFALPRRAEIVALGGIDAARISACREVGFDAVAVLGALWQAADPVRAFHQLNLACRHAHAA
jgi:thiamine-phosphate pyrophosphorylase